MTHFAVLVIGDVEEELQPFEILDITQDKLSKFPNAKFDLILPHDKVEEEFEKWKIENQNNEIIKKYITAKEWIENHNDYHYNEEGYGFYYNPDCKYDYYVIGGRWSDYLKLKDGSYTDQALMKDVDWELMKNIELENAKQNWTDYHLKIKEPNLTDFDKQYLEFYYALNQDITKEKYLKTQGKLSTFAVVKDGQWYQKNNDDNIKWNEEFEELLNSIPPDELVTIIDCHA